MTNEELTDITEKISQKYNVTYQEISTVVVLLDMFGYGPVEKNAHILRAIAESIDIVANLKNKKIN